MSIEAFYKKCAEHSLKVTPQRVHIYQELVQATDHPSVDALFQRVRKALPNISFDTVYRTLLSFTEIGLISLVEGYGEQKRFEVNAHQHHHFRCMKCHSIYDFESDVYDNIAIPSSIKKQGVIMSKRVVLEGICLKCKGK